MGRGMVKLEGACKPTERKHEGKGRREGKGCPVLVMKRGGRER